MLDVRLSDISVMLRKSYEFEDLLQSSSDSCRVDWYAQSRLGITRTLSEENVYEDIIGNLDVVTSFALTCVCVCVLTTAANDQFCIQGRPDFHIQLAVFMKFRHRGD